MTENIETLEEYKKAIYVMQGRMHVMEQACMFLLTRMIQAIPELNKLLDQLEGYAKDLETKNTEHRERASLMAEGMRQTISFFDVSQLIQRTRSKN